MQLLLNMGKQCLLVERKQYFQRDAFLQYCFIFSNWKSKFHYTFCTLNKFIDYVTKSKLISEHLTRKGFLKSTYFILQTLLTSGYKKPIQHKCITAVKRLPFTPTILIQISLSDFLRCKRIFDNTAFNLLQHYNQTILVPQVQFISKQEKNNLIFTEIFVSINSLKSGKEKPLLKTVRL